MTTMAVIFSQKGGAEFLLVPLLCLTVTMSTKAFLTILKLGAHCVQVVLLGGSVENRQHSPVRSS